jgi:NCAIR mutase (PurE)-related protein
VKNNELQQLLRDVQSGGLAVTDAMERLSAAVDAGPAIAEIDTDRMRRTGHPEVVFGQGKEPDDIVDILGRLARANQPGLVTRLTDEKAQHIMEQLPDAKWHRRARVLHLPAPGHELQPQVRGTIVIACAGTSDLPVAEEAAVMAEAFGHPVERIWDVGVAGLQRILNHQNSLQSASVVIVVAGMEGALASVVAGLVSCPVVAVPTSVGYGASFQGLAALLGMLNACATGVSVVNIDNGFGAAMMAMRINEVRG